MFRKEKINNGETSSIIYGLGKEWIDTLFLLFLRARYMCTYLKE